MLSWLKRKSENARIYMCTKELYWFIQSAQPDQVASVLFYAHDFRFRGDIFGPIFSTVVDDPTYLSRDEIMHFYCTLEDIRNHGMAQFSEFKKNLKRLGVQDSKGLAERMLPLQRGMELWMTTIAMPLVPDLREQILFVWRALGSAHSQIPFTIENMKKEKSFADSIDGRSSGPSLLDLPPDEILSECSYVPAHIRRGLLG